MKGVTSKVLIVLGILLVVASILWWAIAVNVMVKFPGGVDIAPVYEGSVKIYFNELTGEFLKESLDAPLSIIREIKSRDDLYTSDRAVVQERITQTIGIPGVAPIIDESSYVLDRKSMENVSDPVNSWAYSEEKVVDRSGTYYINFPFDLDKDKTYKVADNKSGSCYELSIDKDEEEEDLEGLRVYNFQGELPESPAVEAYVEHMGYPQEIDFEKLKELMRAKGFEVDGMMAVLQEALSPEDLQLLQAGLALPIKLDYYHYSSGKASLEPRTGSIIRLRDVVEGVRVAPALGQLLQLLERYSAENEKVAEVLKNLKEMEKQPVYEARCSQTDESVKEAAADASDNINKINWVKVYVPWILLIVGAALLVGGLLMGGTPAALEEEGGEGSEDTGQ